MVKSVSPGPKVRETFAVERREQLLRLINERGRVRTGELAKLSPSRKIESPSRINSGPSPQTAV